MRRLTLRYLLHAAIAIPVAMEAHNQSFCWWTIVPLTCPLLRLDVGSPGTLPATS